MANPFDQFDQPQGNPFDQFDAAPAAPALSAPQQPAAVDNRPVGDMGDAIMEPLRTFATGAIASPIAGLAGLGAAGARALGFTEAEPADVVRSVQGAMTYQPRTKVGEAVTNAVSYPFEKIAQGADYLGGKTADATGSPALGAAVTTAIQAAPIGLLKGRGKPAQLKSNDVRGPANLDRTVVPAESPPPSQAATSAKRSPGLGRVSKAAPTVEELAAQSKAAYKRAKDAGIAISEESFGGLKSRIAKDLEVEGIDQTLHPSTTAALKRISETDGPVTLEKVETLRRIAKDAQRSLAPADQRLASKIVDDIDDFVEGLSERDVTSGNPKHAAAMKEARDLYSRKMKAEEIDRLIERAELSAPNFSASGMENALRTEFRALAKNEKKMRRFSQQERAAIVRVAKGGPIENALRMLGKFSPTGVVSAGLGSGVGFVAGGPIGAVALPAAGLASRYAATRMTLRNAKEAQEIMRRGPTNALRKEEKRNALLEY